MYWEDHVGNGSMLSNGTSPEGNPLENLYPAIVQCFSIIIMGYVSGRCHMITPSQAEGLGTYISKFALPALLFYSMYLLDLSVVRWSFLGGICLAKSTMFILVVLTKLFLGRPRDWGKAALYGMFTTQSNDLALGYPIVSAIYAKTHPEYVYYLYLIAPISLVFLNPIGFTMLEIQKWKSVASDLRTSKPRALVNIFKGVLLNPILFMSVLGIAGNFAFNRNMPKVLDQLLSMLGQSFSATALFFLGHSLVGKVQKQNKKALFSIFFLVCAKMLLLPLLARECTVWLLHMSPSHSQNVTTNTDLSNYAFLYGTFPTAPSVFLYGSQYGQGTDIIASGLVVGTFLSAPMMFVSARMVTLHVTSEADYRSLIMETSFDVSLLTVATSVWVIGVFILGHRIKTIPHQFTLALVISQLCCAVGVILWVHLDAVRYPWTKYLQYSLFMYGFTSVQCWTAVIAICLCALKTRSLCFILKHMHWLCAFGFGLPICITPGLVILSANQTTHGSDPAFAFGKYQLIATSCLLTFTIISVVTSLIIRHRNGFTTLVSRSRQVSVANQDTAVSGNSNPTQDLTNTTSRSPENDVTSPASPIQQNEGPSINSPGAQNAQEGEERGILARKGRVRKRRKSIRDDTAATDRERKRSVGWEECREDCTTCDRPSCSSVSNIEDIVPYPSSVQRGADPTESVFEDCETGDRQRLLPHTMSCAHLDRASCEPECREQCNQLLESYHVHHLGYLKDEEAVVAQSRDHHQETRHVILILLVLLTTLVELFVCLLKLMHEPPNGVYVEIEFLHCVLCYGQGIYAFGLFGLDMEVVVAPFMKRLRKLFYGAFEIKLTPVHDLDPSTLTLAETFLLHHQETCVSAIVGCKKYHWRQYRNVFTGAELVNWLIEVGLSLDRADATRYGQQLLLGRVIEHAQKEYYFHDLPYLYRFNEDDVLE